MVNICVVNIKYISWNSLYILLMAATSTLLLTSCSHDDAVQQERQVMSFRMATEKVPVSRAAANVNNIETFQYPSDFTIAVDDENFTYTANSSTAPMMSSAPAYFPVNGSSVRVRAYYPSFKMYYAETAQTFTVAQDQSQTDMGTNNYRVSDLMYGVPREDFTEFDSDGKIMPTSQSIPLVFDHKMAKISIIANTNGSVIKKMTMLNVLRSIDFNPVDTTFSNLAEADDGLGNSVLLYDDETGQGGTFTCSAVIPRQSLAAGTELIEVVVEDFPNDQVLHYYLQEDAMFWPGKHYEYNLNITMTGVSVTVRMVPWESSGYTWNNDGNPLEL